MPSRVNCKYQDESFSERNCQEDIRYSQPSSPYQLMDEDSIEFSFKQKSHNGQQVFEASCSLYKSQSMLSLKQNLEQLPKSQIIDLLIEEINFSQVDPTQRQRLNDTLKEITKPKDSKNTKKQQPNYKKQYDQLVRDFQQYINNTRQAQQHYVKLIEDLKKQNKNLQNQFNKKLKDSNHSSAYSPRSHSNKNASMIQKLQQTVQNYLQINNDLIFKVQKLQKINKETLQKSIKLQKDTQLLKEENEFMIKENQKLKKQNLSFKSIVDQLKDYIMERREAKEQGDENQETQRSNVSQNDEIRQNTKKYEMQKNVDDSIINSSQIRRRQLTLNDSTLMFQKDSQRIINAEYQDKQQKMYNQLQQNESKFPEFQAMSKALKIMQVQNEELRINNQKLGQILSKKCQKINILLQEIQTLKNEANMVSQQNIELKSRLKRNLSFNESATASKCTNQDRRFSVMKDEICIKSSKVQKDSINEGLIKRYSHCTESQFKKKPNISNFQLEEQNKHEQSKHKKSFNLESFNLLKGQLQNKFTYQNNKHLQKSSQQYYIPKNLIVSNKKF